MTTNRRDFLKKSGLFVSGMSFATAFPASIQRALEIAPEKGSTFLDAEHIVFLMQENRSFDHAFGNLKGVRGYNDPRVFIQPNGLPVWFQQNQKDIIYGPFHLDIKNTKITWMGDLPHAWDDMVQARNKGSMNDWLTAKEPRNLAFKDLPLTMGYFSRSDIPFYYALADAFTVCDQYFSSSLTGTSPNRSFFWSGTIRERPNDHTSEALVYNNQMIYKDLDWRTYPERLEAANVSWCVYQNELSLPVGLSAEASEWLANFTDNNLEFHKQYNVKFHKAYQDFLEEEEKRIYKELQNQELSSENRITLEIELEKITKDREKYSLEAFNKLSGFQQAIHKKAFTTNIGDPYYHNLQEMQYEENGVAKKIKLPKGDVLYQFRKDVEQGNLPTVSWLVAPSNFSDHPTAPWFGAWYVSEILNILTKNPEIWRKTIFILNYDENDGYFDHVPPFTPPLSTAPEQGKVPKGMDTRNEWITKKQDTDETRSQEEGSPIGLGYRVPMIVVSPWTKGGWVNSEVFDHTSTLQFLEYFLEKKTGKKIVEENISQWRREVCGNLTSVFQNQKDWRKGEVDFLKRDTLIKNTLLSKDKSVPSNFEAYKAEDLIKQKEWQKLRGFPNQEHGIKKSNALPYIMEADLIRNVVDNTIKVVFTVKPTKKQNKVSSAPFYAIAQRSYESELGRQWNFAVRQNEPIDYLWNVASFESECYHLNIHGPNGFYRSFKGEQLDQEVIVKVTPDNQLMVHVELINPTNKELHVTLKDRKYLKTERDYILKPKKRVLMHLDYKAHKGWYDFELILEEEPLFLYQYAGHIENGEDSYTDGYMARL